MNLAGSSSVNAIPTSRPKEPRCRSVPSARPFRIAVLFSAIHYLLLIAAVTAIVCFFVEPGIAPIRIFIVATLGSALAWFIAFFKRRSTHCPLCKGTPLINSGARVHSRAKRVFPFNHGVSSTLSILTHQKFRCMYCGSDYDLLKPRTKVLYDEGE
jgi:hypothetical protein